MATQSEDPNERVNHPRHYTQHPSGIECIDVIEHLSCNMANAIKYIWRCGLKASETPLRDLQSARWYVEREERRIDFFELGEAPSKLDVVWRSLAHRVIEKDGGGLLGNCLSALLAGSFDDVFFFIDKAIGALEALEAPPASPSLVPLPVIHLYPESSGILPEWCVTSHNKGTSTDERNVVALFHDEAAAKWFAKRWAYAPQDVAAEDKPAPP